MLERGTALMSKTTKAASAGGPGRRGRAAGGNPTDGKKPVAKNASDGAAPKSSAAPKKTSAGRTATGKATAGKATATPKKSGASTAKGTKKRKGGASAIADAVLADEHPPSRVSALADDLLDERETTATSAARALGELLSRKPELLVPHVERFAHGLTSGNRRVIQTSAEALPTIARHAPARVARQLDILKAAFDETNPVGRDGLVRTFANLCIASVAYQKRLEPVLTRALSTADGPVLVEWTDVVLPALKGEPHARARAVVEDRLPALDRTSAQKIADYLGIKLRPVPR